MLVKILIGLAVFVAALALFIATRPASYRYERSTIIKASPAQIFPYINDLRRWEQWSPWIEIAPDSNVTFNDIRDGTGMSMHWEGDPKAGEGTMTIIESTPDELVRLRLDFVKPMAGTATSDITLSPADGGTRVAWSMYGENNFLGKAVGLIMNCEKMIGDQYAKGLAKMKAIFESGKPIAPAD